MGVKNKIDVVRFLQENQSKLLSYGVEKIGIFGSFSRDEQKDTSDIDLLVDFHPNDLNYKNFIGLTHFLEDQLEREVDLVTSDSLSPYLGPIILKEVEYVPLR